MGFILGLLAIVIIIAMLPTLFTILMWTYGILFAIYLTLKEASSNE